MYQNVSEGKVQLSLFTPSYFGISDHWWEWNYPHHTFFWTQNCYLLTWNLATHTKYFKNSQKVKRTFWMWNGIFYWSHHISAFSAGYLTFIVFVRLQTLVLFFLSSPGFCEFQCPFCKNTFIKGMFYFKLVWRKLKSIKF